MRAFAIALLCLVLASCDDPKTAQRSLEALGMTNIQLQGYGWWGCDNNDTFSTKFTATNPQGHKVSGVVCSGWWKNGTVRFD